MILEKIKIRINNLFAIITFVCLKQFFRKKKSTSNRVLFINTGLLGDVIISSLILKNEAKLNNVSSTIYILFDKRFAGLFKEYNGNINLLFLNSNKYRLNLFYRISFLRELRKLDLEKSINISFCRRTFDDEITLLSGSHNSIGFVNAPKIPKLFSDHIDSNYSEIIKPPTGNHYLDIVYLLERLGIKSPYHETLMLNLKNIPSDFHKNLKTNKKVISLAPQTSRSIKDWNYENFVELVGQIIEKFNAIVILLGDKKNDTYIIKSNSNIIDLKGATTLEEAASIIAISDLFIGNDSGLFHLAKTNGIPRIGLIGGGAVNVVFPYGNTENEILLYKEMNCFGCHWKCIYEKAHCLQEVTVENVINSVRLLLKDE